jgi:hypothetical protein
MSNGEKEKDQPKSSKIPSPGGKVACPSVSEEIAGRKRNAGGNLKIRTT